MQPQILYSQRPLRTATFRRQGTEPSPASTLREAQVHKQPNHNPVIAAHLPASEFTQRSLHRCLGAHHSHCYLHTCRNRGNTSRRHCTHKPYMHVYTPDSAHTCAHTQTPDVCVRPCPRVRARTHAYSVPYLIANAPSLGSVTLNFNPQACFWPFTLGIYS